ncbi:hypothetical protein ACKKBF_B34985 [Auxenochlorella protothecoides x Auxenochlorella symbiontica]
MTGSSADYRASFTTPRPGGLLEPRQEEGQGQRGMSLLSADLGPLLDSLPQLPALARLDSLLFSSPRWRALLDVESPHAEAGGGRGEDPRNVPSRIGRKRSWEMPAAEGAASARPDSPAGVTGPAAYKSQRTEYAPSYRPAPGSLPQGFVPVLQGGSPASLAGKQGSEDEFGQDLSPVDVLHRHDSGLSSLLRSVPSAHDSPDTPRSTSSPEAGAGGYAPAHAGAGAGLSRLARAGGEGTPRPAGPARAVPDAARPTALTAAAMGPRRRPHCPTKSTKAVPTGENGVFTSLFRGVTKHRLTGRYEAHFWDASHKRETKGKGGRTRGRQVYLGGYTSEEEAARAYDLAALAFLGAAAAINFPVEDYTESLAEMEELTSDEVVSRLRRGSVGFARGASQYRGVTKHHQHGKWEARIGRVDGSKYLYLGTFESAEEAARAYDRAAVKFRGRKAITNFKLTMYEDVLQDPDSYDLGVPQSSTGPYLPDGSLAVPGVQTRSGGRARRGTQPMLPMGFDPGTSGLYAPYVRCDAAGNLVVMQGPPPGLPHDHPATAHLAAAAAAVGLDPSMWGHPAWTSPQMHEGGGAWPGPEPGQPGLQMSGPSQAQAQPQQQQQGGVQQYHDRPDQQQYHNVSGQMQEDRPRLSPVKVRPPPAHDGREGAAAAAHPPAPGLSPLAASLMSPLGLKDGSRGGSGAGMPGQPGSSSSCAPDGDFWAAVHWLDSLDLAHGLPPAGANSGLGPAPLSPLGITPLAPH